MAKTKISGNPHNSYTSESSPTPSVMPVGPLVGSGFLNMITTGLYNNPLAVYREYLQNSADALAGVGRTSDGSVTIGLDPEQMSARIRDNGPGLLHKEVVRALVPIARSQKVRGKDRGFRGVGRLSGLAFAQSVTFLTRACGEDQVSRVVWDGTTLRQKLRETDETEQSIRDAVRVDLIDGSNFPEHFFEVVLSGICRRAAGAVLNRDAVRAYIAEVCPVPIDRDFRFAKDVDALFGANNSSVALRVTFDKTETPIVRPYGNRVRLLPSREDRITEFEVIQVPSADSDDIAAAGWVAHSSYMGAITPDAGVRGIRAREGNIQIGDEDVFAGLFPEERFNRWCVGEVHILDSRIIPNGRRDYFEPSPHTRNLENQLISVFRGITARCRKASATRNSAKQISATIQELGVGYELVTGGYLPPKESQCIAEIALARISSVRARAQAVGNSKSVEIIKLAKLEKKFRSFQAPTHQKGFYGIPANQANVYRRIFGILARVSSSFHAAKRTIDEVLAADSA